MAACLSAFSARMVVHECPGQRVHMIVHACSATSTGVRSAVFSVCPDASVLEGALASSMVSAARHAGTLRTSGACTGGPISPSCARLPCASCCQTHGASCARCTRPTALPVACSATCLPAVTSWHSQPATQTTCALPCLRSAFPRSGVVRHVQMTCCAVTFAAPMTGLLPQHVSEPHHYQVESM